jgi:hypothetical protein
VIAHNERYGAPEVVNTLTELVSCAEITRAAGNPEAAAGSLEQLAAATRQRFAWLDAGRLVYLAGAYRDLGRYREAREADTYVASLPAAAHIDQLRVRALVGLSADELALGNPQNARLHAHAALDATEDLCCEQLQLRHAALLALAAAGGGRARAALVEARQLEQRAEVSAAAHARAEKLACVLALDDAPATCRSRARNSAALQPAR